MILEDVIEEHAEEAAFLWGQRDAAVRAPDYDLEELTELDERVEAHLDGLRIAGASGMEIVKEVGFDLPGEYFAGMALALRLHAEKAIDALLDATEGDDAATRALISAFGWTAPRDLASVVKRLLPDPSPHRRRVAIGACAVHRVNPGSALERALTDEHEGLRARAFKTAGELGLVDQRPKLEQALDDEDEEARFWAAWAAVRLGSQSARRILGLFVTSENPRKRQALELAVRVMQHEQAVSWLRQLAGDPNQLRYALIGAGAQGDPFFLPGLVGQFGNESHARVAGEAFEMITGLNIFQQSLEVIPEQPEPTTEQEPVEQTPEELLAEADEEDDDYEDLGEDMGLVLPDPAKMTPWFERNRSRFDPGSRYLCGKPISNEHCLAVLRNGQQRQRRAAALELALADPSRPLFECRAPGIRQVRRLRKAG